MPTTHRNERTDKKSSSTSSPTTPKASVPSTPVGNGTTGQAPTPPATQAQTTATTASPVTGVAAGAKSKRAGKTDLQASYVALMAGLQSFYQPTDVFQLETGNETCAQLVSDFQAYVNAAEQTKTSNKAWRADVQAEQQALDEVAPKRAALFTTLQGRFGKTGVTLLQFGFAPYKPHKVTAEGLITGVTKAKATREARGTKGKKQKLEVSGSVTGVTITPVTTTAETPAATPSGKPAGSAS